MPAVPDLDDINQTVIYVPFDEEDASSDEHENIETEEYGLFKDRDISGGYEARMDAYSAAWNKCFDRLQSVIDALHAPVAEQIIREVEQAYDDVLPGLPYPEIPVISIYGSSTGPSFVKSVALRLGFDPEERDDGESSRPESHVIHLAPSDCPNIMSGMKALVSGFVERPPDGQEVKRKPTTSLANYDIELLKTWYGVLRESREPPPQLVVFMHDFEQFDDSVVQDMFYICSPHIPQLPIVFVLSLSSPPSPSYLHTVYPRSTMSLLRVQSFTLPSGIEVLERLVTETFFALDFEPDIAIGPSALEYLSDFFTRHSSSLDGLSIILQLAHMKHFDEPLTIFVRDELLGTKSITSAAEALSTPDCFAFLDTLLAWSTDPHTVTNNTGWGNTDVSALLLAVREARVQFQTKLRGIKLAFGILRTVQRVMLSFGYRSAETDKSLLELMSAAMKGQLEREGKYLGMMTKKLPADKLKVLLEELTVYASSVPTHLVEDLQSPNAVFELISGMSDDGAVAAATQLGDWLTKFLDEHIVNLEDSHLWEIWYTGSTPFPSELINPNTRASVLSGVLNPYDYLPEPNEDQSIADALRRRMMWELPDTSILLRRYLEAGRMINVYDWYESFSMAVDSQRRHMDEKKSLELEETDQEGREEEEERWKMHVQARFIRALHQLDFLGFVKHTGRKADHIVRTVFDVPE
ncbi:hypothetical protein BV25DRAFT_1828445 [Artomyces pyxidatus]|uniref:Uncharacterized protein n=1 Tax=Artomyces pyxidatus TaxID=48021 RepID=A0ACB8SUX5_9AGAM|nr:hypothetical protein BV25DRAFT_1828445 [Artomyces pyxidatus]